MKSNFLYIILILTALISTKGMACGREIQERSLYKLGAVKVEEGKAYLFKMVSNGSRCGKAVSIKLSKEEARILKLSTGLFLDVIIDPESKESDG